MSFILFRNGDDGTLWSVVERPSKISNGRLLKDQELVHSILDQVVGEPWASKLSNAYLKKLSEGSWSHVQVDKQSIVDWINSKTH